MCVRTKTSYGCGHSYKSTEECDSSRCELERYHYIHEGDCVNCRRGGNMVTRGREGKGRYAKEITKRSVVNERAPLEELSQNATSVIDICDGTGPWASQQASRRDNLWQSPTRRKADDAWQVEHDQRMADLQTRLEKLNNSSSSPKRSRQEPVELVVDENHDYPQVEDDHYYSDESQRRRDRTAEKLQKEIRSINQEQRSTWKPHRYDDRHRSYDSIESMPLVYTTTKKIKPIGRSHTYDLHDYYDHHDSGYGSYSSYRSYGPSARTEPYLHSSTRTYELPLTPYQYNGVYPSGYGVEIYPRTASVRNYSRRH